MVRFVEWRSLAIVLALMLQDHLVFPVTDPAVRTLNFEEHISVVISQILLRVSRLPHRRFAEFEDLACGFVSQDVRPSEFCGQELGLACLRGSG